MHADLVGALEIVFGSPPATPAPRAASAAKLAAAEAPPATSSSSNATGQHAGAPVHGGPGRAVAAADAATSAAVQPAARSSAAGGASDVSEAGAAPAEAFETDDGSLGDVLLAARFAAQRSDDALSDVPLSVRRAGSVADMPLSARRARSAKISSSGAALAATPWPTVSSSAPAGGATIGNTFHALLMAQRESQLAAITAEIGAPALPIYIDAEAVDGGASRFTLQSLHDGDPLLVATVHSDGGVGELLVCERGSYPPASPVGAASSSYAGSSGGGGGGSGIGDWQAAAIAVAQWLEGVCRRPPSCPLRHMTGGAAAAYDARAALGAGESGAAAAADGSATSSSSGASASSSGGGASASSSSVSGSSSSSISGSSAAGGSSAATAAPPPPCAPVLIAHGLGDGSPVLSSLLRPLAAAGGLRLPPSFRYLDTHQLALTLEYESLGRRPVQPDLPRQLADPEQLRIYRCAPALRCALRCTF